MAEYQAVYNDEDPSTFIREYTMDDLYGLKDFTAALRNRLQLATEEADAADPRGRAKAPLNADVVSNIIRTDPELSRMWGKLSQAQRSYAHNRYVRNTPDRYASKRAFGVGPADAALEHDYHRIHNPKMYQTGRMFELTGGELTKPGVTVTGNVMYGLDRGWEWLRSKATGKPMRAYVGGSNQIEGMTRGGFSRYAEGSPHALVAQPTTASQRAAEAFIPMGVDVTANALITAPLGGVGGVVSGTGKAAKVINGTAKVIHAINSPISTIKNPKLAWKCLTHDPKLAYRMLRRHGLKSAGTALWHPTINWGLRSWDVAQDLHQLTTMATNPVAAYYMDEPGAAYIPEADRDMHAYAQQVSAQQQQQQQAQPSPNQTNRRSLLEDILHKSTYGSNGWNWGGAAVGGGLLGMLLGGKNRLAGGILGALLGAGGLAAYNYYKNKDI
jgi:hypothetical protein